MRPISIEQKQGASLFEVTLIDAEPRFTGPKPLTTEEAAEAARILEPFEKHHEKIASVLFGDRKSPEPWSINGVCPVCEDSFEFSGEGQVEIQFRWRCSCGHTFQQMGDPK